MLLFLILILTEFLAFLALRQHFKGYSRTRYFLSMVINSIFSCLLWIFYIELSSYKGDYDNPDHICLMMSFNGILVAIVAPRDILCILHFTGLALSLRREINTRIFTNAGIIIWLVFLMPVTAGTLIGRFNVRTEGLIIKTGKLNKYDQVITIVHISDLHLPSYHRHREKLQDIMEEIDVISPDIIVNSGDFISYGYKEFEGFDTILSTATARLGKYAVLGNHDMGIYHPDYNSAYGDTTISRLSEMIRLSGYTLLNDENVIIRDDSLVLGIAGIKTSGKRLDITYGDHDKALSGLDSADFRILISHDPNHWIKDIAGQRDVDLTFSGHTHGMQMGIITRWFRWSPSKYFHPRWNGLYRENDQYLYVNRGLGVLALPFRIGMPPEITVIRLTGAD